MFGIRSRRWNAPLALVGMGTVGFTLGIWQARPAAVSAQTPPGSVVPAAAVAPSDYSQRVVAYIHGNVPVTREELGEYLIARYGNAKLEYLVNRKIIDRACKEKGVTVTNEEVEAAIDTELAQLNVDRATFAKGILKKYTQTLYEWKEDVIRPRLMMTKLCGFDIKVDDAEIKKLYDSKYGEKVQCRLIVWTRTEGGPNPQKLAFQMYDTIRKSEAEFDRAARNQTIPGLAQVGGKIDPIGHGVSEEGKDQIEKIAFSLNKDEMSAIFEIPGQGIAVMKCDGRIPPDTTKSFEKEKEILRKEIHTIKVSKAIPQQFAELKKQATPLLLKPHEITNAYVARTFAEEEKLLSEPLAPLPPQNPPAPKP